MQGQLALCATFKGLDVLMWQRVQSRRGGFTTLPVSRFHKQYWEARGLDLSKLSAGGVIDFT